MMITVIVPRTGGYDKERRIQVEADEVRVVRETADPRWISVKEKLPEYVVPVVHGEFEKQPEEVILNLRATPLLCKTCRTTFITLNKEGKRCMCCSYCGARMDEEENE